MPRRAQDPINFNYQIEEVTFLNKSANIKLAGTITKPNTPIKGIIILLSGSGPQNRNEELHSYNHRPFLVWSDYLTNQGYVVLRYDDRGVNESTGDFKKANTFDFAEDANAAVEFINSIESLKKYKIGFLGHSEGGLVGAIVIKENKRVSFLITLASPAISILKMIQFQSQDLQTKGLELDKKELKNLVGKIIPEYLLNNSIKDETQVREELKKIIIENLNIEFSSLNKKQFFVKIMVNHYSSNWFRTLLNIDPKDFYEYNQVPTLALFGDLDIQVRSRENATMLRSSLLKAKNSNFKILTLKGLNHLFQRAKTGSMDEYGQIEETVNPLALKTITNWLDSILLKQEKLNE